MILSIDACLAFLLTCLVATTFLQATENYEFSMGEIAAQKFSNELALALQEEVTALDALHRGDASLVNEIIGQLGTDYCIEVESVNRGSNCALLQGENVRRTFVAFNGKEFYTATVAVYFSYSNSEK